MTRHLQRGFSCDVIAHVAPRALIALLPKWQPAAISHNALLALEISTVIPQPENGSLMIFAPFETEPLETI